MRDRSRKKIMAGLIAVEILSQSIPVYLWRQNTYQVWGLDY